MAVPAEGLARIQQLARPEDGGPGEGLAQLQLAGPEDGGPLAGEPACPAGGQEGGYSSSASSGDTDKTTSQQQQQGRERCILYRQLQISKELGSAKTMHSHVITD